MSLYFLLFNYLKYYIYILYQINIYVKIWICQFRKNIYNIIKIYYNSDAAAKNVQIISFEKKSINPFFFNFLYVYIDTNETWIESAEN